MPMWVVGLARWLLAEPVTLAALARTAFALAGAMLVLGDGQLRMPLPDSWSDALAIAAGFFFGLNNVLLRKHAATPQEARAFGMFIGAVVIAPMVIAGMAIIGEAIAARAAARRLAGDRPVHGCGVDWQSCLAVWCRAPAGQRAFGADAGRDPVATLSSWLAGAASITQGVVLGGACIVCASVLAIFTGRNSAA